MLETVKQLWPTREKLTGPAITQAGVIPYAVKDGVAVYLLVTSRRTGRWIFPKGGCDAGESAHDCAAREAREEAGVEGEVTGPAIGFYRDRKVHPMRRKLIEVAMYPLRVSKQLEDWPEKDERQRHWATLEEARKLLTTPGLFELVERAEEHILAAQETSGAGHQA